MARKRRRDAPSGPVVSDWTDEAVARIRELIVDPPLLADRSHQVDRSRRGRELSRIHEEFGRRRCFMLWELDCPVTDVDLALAEELAGGFEEWVTSLSG